MPGRFHHPLSLLLLLPLACGCASLNPVPARADLSTPKAAALSYLKAVQYQDLRTARAVSIGTMEEKSWIDSLVTILDGMRRYDSALTAKFGKIVNQVHVDLWQTVRESADQPVELISEGAESIDGDKARVDPPRLGFRSHSAISIYLRKDQQGWKVDLADTYAHDVPPEEIGTVTAKFQQARVFGQIFQKMAFDIRAGHFKSTDDATKALAARLTEATETD